MDSLVLDAWVIMSWLKGQQPAAHFVRNLLDSAERRAQTLVMNIMNFGEVFYLSAKAGDLAYGQRVLNGLRPILVIESATDELVMHAARLKAEHSISYANAFAAATAIAREAPLTSHRRYGVAAGCSGRAEIEVAVDWRMNIIAVAACFFPAPAKSSAPE